MLANSFHPCAITGFGYGKGDTLLPARPQNLSPALDAASSTQPLSGFDAQLHEQSFGDTANDGSSQMPPRPDGFSDPYLYPTLTRNERLRLTMLWYYTRDLVGDERVLQKMQAKVDLLKSLIGWEFAICGLLENDIFQRLTTAGMPLGIVPRRESPCAHTVNQPAGSVFFLSDMSNDWRFAQAPHVTHGGLRTYAGAQLRCQVDNGEDVALGSLCVASNLPGRSLSPSQMELLVQFADMLTGDIIDGSRRKRAIQQEQNEKLLREAFAASVGTHTDDAVMTSLRQVFPESHIDLLPITAGSIQLRPDGPPIALPGSHVKSATWEDGDMIEHLLRTNNHQRLVATQTVRAIIGVVEDKPFDKALVVSTLDITRIFDDVDVRFVEGCAMVLRGIAQERSLQDALRTREHFLRGITHQLRTPIHGILGSVDLLTDEIVKHGLADDAAQHTVDTMSEKLKMIKSSGRELMSIVNNVIKLNRWTESVSTSRAASLGDPSHLESEILEEVSWLLPEGHLNSVSIFFNNTLPIGAGSVQIDMVSLKDCVQSLVLNALQNTSHGSVVVTISSASDYQSLIFDVQDTGHGIAQVDRRRIFDAYEKSDAHSTGVGLGLTIACKIADAMGGTVTLVSSTLDEGSHFRAEFRNPGFACPKQHDRAAVVHAMSRLPECFFLAPSISHSMLDEHFARFLQARGFRTSDDVTSALAVVPFANLSGQCLETSLTGSESGTAICLVPAGEDPHKAMEANPDVLFFCGPFTSDRLDEILVNTSRTYMARRPPPLTTHVPSSDVGAGVQAVAVPELPQSFLPFRQRSITLHDSVPNCLIVDDNLINLRIMRMYCDKRKFPYTTAMDGLQAIDRYKEAVKKAPITLILLDLQMPNCDGIQACEAIRAFEEEEGLLPTVIFIVTGQDSPSDRTKALAAGADRFFVKPVALKGLDRGIAEAFTGT